MTHTPAVSIVVRTYNRPRRLRECLHSLHQQTWRDFETVVVNDAGEDVEPLLPQELGTLPVRYLRHAENRGRTASLNLGVEAAGGEYIGFLDDDDVVYPDHLQTLMEAARPERRPVVYTDVLNVTYQPDPRTGEWIRAQEQLVYSFDFDADNFLLANYIPIHCLAIRRDCFGRVGPFDESLAILEDWEFLIRLSRVFPFHHIPKITGEYRRRDDNSNIRESGAYPVNERIIKRRYRNERDALFDKIFKRTFQQQRELRQQGAQLQVLIQQIQQLQGQLAEARSRAARPREETAPPGGERLA